MKILLIEDRYEIVQAVTFCLELRWPQTEICTFSEAKTGINSLKSENFDFLLLDFDIHDLKGLDILSEIRSFSNIPIIVMAVQNEEEQVRSLEMGADDYIKKPLNPRELIARFNAVLRRYAARPISNKRRTIH